MRLPLTLVPCINSSSSKIIYEKRFPLRGPAGVVSDPSLKGSLSAGAAPQPSTLLPLSGVEPDASLLTNLNQIRSRMMAVTDGPGSPLQRQVSD